MADRARDVAIRQDAIEGRECAHEEWDEEETGPINRAGQTRIYLVCTICGEARQTGVGSVL